MINEISQGPGGVGGEYIEFVVVGDPSDPTAPVDISGWIVDDNNANQSGVGTADGHLVFGAGYSAVPPGSIIVVFWNQNANPQLPPTDAYDSDGDGVYIASHNQNSSFDLCYSNPSTSDNNENFCPCENLNDPSQGLIWMPAMANDRDLLQVRDDCETVVHAVSFQLNASQMTSDISGSPVWVELNPGNQAGMVLNFTNSVSDDWSNPANYTSSATGATNETPGAPNNAANAAFISDVAAGIFNCTGEVASCEQTDAGEITLENPVVPGFDIDASTVSICESDDVAAFTVSWPGGSEPSATGFDFEYAFLLVDPATGTIVDYVIAPTLPYTGDFDFSGYLAGESYDVYGFSYFHSNDDNTLSDFLTQAPFNISTTADILNYSDCGYAGNLSATPIAVDIYDLLTADIMPNSGFCTGGQYILDGNPDGGTEAYTHNWSDGVAGVIVAPFDEQTVDVDLTGVAPGTAITILYTVTDANGCFESSNLSFTVGGDDVVFSYLTIEECAPTSGETDVDVDAAPVTAGGTYTIDPVTGLTVDPSTGMLTLDSSSTPGDYLITYTVDNGTCVSADTQPFTVLGSVDLMLTPDPMEICESGDPFTVTATTTPPTVGSFEWGITYIAGTVPGSTGVDADSWPITPTAADDGAIVSVTFTADDTALCPATADAPISVVSAPSPPDPVTDDVLIYCTGATIQPITVNFVPGYTVEWYEDAALATPLGDGSGTYTPAFDISYDPTESYPLILELYVLQYDPNNPDCASDPFTIEITINEGQQSSLNYYDAVICEDIGIVDLAATFQPNLTGSWTGDPNISGNNFDVATAGPGTYNIIFEEQSDCSSPSDPLNLEVIAAPEGTLLIAPNVCPETPAFSLSDYIGTAPAGGTWTDETGAVVTEYDPALYSSTAIFTYSMGDCTKPGTTGICTTIFDPVCGCDGNTYSNDCEADLAGINYITYAECTGFEWFDIDGCELSLDLTVIKDDVPGIGFASPYSICASDDFIDLFNEPEVFSGAAPALNGTWTGDAVFPEGVFDVAAAWAANPDQTQAIDVIVNLAYTDPCAFSEDLTITITPPVDLSPLQESVCDGQLVNLDFVYPAGPGETVLWYSEDPSINPGSFIDPSQYAFIPTEDVTLYLTVSQFGSDCSAETTFDISFSELLGFNNIDEFHCSGEELDLSTFEPLYNTESYDGQFTWFDEDPSVNPAATPMSDLLVTPTQNPSTYFVQFEQAVTTCAAETVLVLTVQPSQLVEFTETEIQICFDGSSVDLNDWLVTPYLGAEWSGSYTDADGMLDVVAAADAGDTSFDVTYSTGTGDCDETESITVNILEGANPSWDPPGSFCHTSAFPYDALITGDTGGQWLDWNGDPLDPSTDEFPFADLTGSDDLDITYSVAGSAECPPSEETWTIPVFLNHVLVNNPINLCGNEIIVDLNDVSIIEGDTNGEWSYDGTTLVGSTFNPSSYGAGPGYELVFTPPSFPACDQLTLIVNVAEAPEWDDEVFTICADGGAIDLDSYLPSDAPSGEWSTSNATVNITAAQFTNPEAVTGELIDFVFTVPDTEPCAGTYSMAISVSEELSAIFTPNAICYEPGAVNLNDHLSPDPPGGNWIIDGSPLASGNLDPFNYDVGSSIEITYQIEAIGDCPEPAPAVFDVDIVSAPDPAWEPFVVCDGDPNVDLNEQLIDDALSGEWVGTGVSGNTFSPSDPTIDPGLYELMFTPEGGAGSCSADPFVATVLVLRSSTATVNTGTISVCEEDGLFTLEGLVDGLEPGEEVFWTGSCVNEAGNIFDPAGFAGETMEINGVVFNPNCKDPTSIDLSATCPAVIDPVCGCDGLTYSNSCEAEIYGGILDYVPGACPDAGDLDCSTTLTIFITVDPPVSVVPVPLPPICNDPIGGPTTIDLNEAIPDNITGSWTAANGSISGSTFNAEGLPAGQVIATFTPEATNSCEPEEVQVIIEIIPCIPDCPSIISLPVDSEQLCNNEQTELTLELDGAGATIQWTNSIGFVLGSEAVFDAGPFTNETCNMQSEQINYEVICDASGDILAAGSVSIEIYPTDLSGFFTSAGEGTCDTSVTIDPGCTDGLLTVDAESQTGAPGTNGIHEYNFTANNPAGLDCASDFTFEIPYNCPLDCPTDPVAAASNTDVCHGETFSLLASMGSGSDINVDYIWTTDYAGVGDLSNPSQVEFVQTQGCLAIPVVFTLTATCAGEVIPGGPNSTVTVNYYPEIPLPVMEIPGSCGQAGSAVIFNPDDSICASYDISAPANPPCGTGDPNSETSSYEFIFYEGTPCEQSVNGEIVSVCEPVECNECPSTIESPVMQSTCAGTSPVLPIVELINDNGNAIEWYQGNPVGGSLFDDYSFENNGCEPISVSFSAYIPCDEDEDPNTPDVLQDLSYTFTVEIQPVQFTVIETPGACGIAAMIQFLNADGSVCLDDQGAIPTQPACGTGLIDQQDLPYTFVGNSGSICEYELTGTVAAECPAIECNECPSTTDTPVLIEICSGSSPTLPSINLIDANGAQPEWFIGDPVNGTALTDVDFANSGCAVVNLILSAYILCDLDEDPNTPEEYVDLLFAQPIEVYPAAFTANTLEGACGIAATVSIVSANGSECAYVEAPLAPAQPECDEPDDDQSLNYTEIFFEGNACEQDFSGFVTALCASVPCAGCPTTSTVPEPQEICSGDLVTVPELVLEDTNGNAVEWFQGDPLSGGISFEDSDLSNQSCEANTILFAAYIPCDVDNDPVTLQEYVSLGVSWELTIFPQAFESQTTEGACGLPASILIVAADGSNCFDDTGDAPTQPACDQPDDDRSLPFDQSFFVGSACEQNFSGLVPATCASVPCAGCPFTNSTVEALEVCSGDNPGTPALVIEDPNGNDPEWFIGEPSSGLAFADVDLSNQGCTPLVYNFGAFILCDTDNDPGTADAYISLGLNWNLSVYPEALTDASVAGSCDNAAIISILAADGSECYFDEGGVPVEPACGEPDADESVTYTDSYFLGSPCEQIFDISLPAFCAAPPCVACPSTNDEDSVGEICSDEVPLTPTLSLVDDNGLEVEWFFGTATDGTPLADLNFTNETCEERSIIIGAFILCDDDNDPTTPNIYINLDYKHQISIYPAPFSVNEQVGGCGTAAFAELISASSEVCETQTGNVPANPICDSGLDNQEPLNYLFEVFAGTGCIQLFGNTIEATCPAVPCTSCPSTADLPTAESLCSSEAITVPVLELFDANSNEVVWYVGDPVTGTALEDFSTLNETCDLQTVVFNAYILCDEDEDPNTPETYINLSFGHVVDIFPAAFTAVEQPGGCELAAQVIILSANGTECDGVSGDEPQPQECGTSAVDDRSLPYQQTFFSEGPCPSIFDLLIPAICASEACLSCPATADQDLSVDYCQGDLLQLPDPVLTDDNGNAVQWFEGDPDTGTALEDLDLSNNTCDPISFELNAYILCDDDGDPITAEVYVSLDHRADVSVFPAAFSDSITPGACELPGSVQILAVDSSICDEGEGSVPVPPACDSGETEIATWTYFNTFHSGTPCEQVFEVEVPAICEAVECTNCPSTADQNTNEELCSGEEIVTPTLILNDSNGFDVEWFQGDPQSGVPLAIVSNVNETCEPIEIALTAWILCDIDEDPASPEEYQNLFYTHSITLYPAAYTPITVTGECNIAATVTYFAVDGTDCGGDVGIVPELPECGSGQSDIQDLIFSDVYFAGSPCEFTMQGGVAASCDALPCSDCPSTIDTPSAEAICNGDLPNMPQINLVNDNANPVQWFQGDPDSGTALADIDFSVPDCDNVSITLNAFILCDEDDDPITPENFVDLQVSHSVTVFPDLSGTTSGTECTVDLTVPCADWTVSWEEQPGGTSGNGSNVEILSPGQSGTVTFTISDPLAPLGCATNSVVANYDCAGCEADASFSIPAALCEGDLLDLNDLVTGNAGGSWTSDAPEGVLIDGSIFTSDNLGGSTFNISYTDFIDVDCNDSQTATISILDIPEIDAGPDQTACADETIALNGIFSGTSSVLWSGGTGSFSSPANLLSNYTPAEGDLESFYLYLSSADDCGSYVDSLLITLLPVEDIILGPTQSIEVGNSIDLSIVGGQGEYLWSDPLNTLSCTDCPNPTATPLVPSTYTVSSLDGCSQGSIFIDVLQPPNMLVPNAFSPNGDSLNDVFKPVASQVEFIEFFVYDRWGKLIFASKDLNQGWDGTFKGEEMPLGVYVYYMNYNYFNEPSLQAQGNVTLVR